MGSGPNDTMTSKGGAGSGSGGGMNASRRGASGGALNASRGSSSGLPTNRAALLRAAEKKRANEAGYHGRENPAKTSDLPPFWSTSKHGVPYNEGDPMEIAKGGARPGGANAGVFSKSLVRASVSAGLSVSASLGPAQMKLNDLRKALESPHSHMGHEERVRAIAKLPPYEHIVALVKGLDRDPYDTTKGPWTGDKPEVWKKDPERCVRRAVVALEARMRESLARVVAAENKKALSPCYTEKDFLMRVFQRVDKNRHGRFTGDCDLAMFLQAWGSAPPEPDDADDDENENEKNEFAGPASVASIASTPKPTEIVVPTVLANAVAAAETADADASRSMEPGPTMTSSPTKMVGKKPIAGRRAKDPNAAAAAAAKENAKGPGDAKSASTATASKAASSPVKKLTSSVKSLGIELKAEKQRPRDDKFEKIDLVPVKYFDEDGLPHFNFDPISQSAAAAVFVKYGYDRDGYMPYEVFIQALLASPSRLLGMEHILDAKDLGRHGFELGDDYQHDGKIQYPKCRGGVFPPNEFDPEHVVRSSKAPDAELALEHVYGYAGLENNAPNLFYLTTGEVVYYTAAVGVVLDKDKLEKKTQCQRFFFGHDDDIKCLAIHPNREWVATGQLGRRPYVCVWDAISMRQLQKIVHPAGMRGVIAVGFSMSDGGEYLTAVNSDNGHTVMVWNWTKHGDDAVMDNAVEVPGWCFGPAKRVDGLEFYEESGGAGAGGRSSKKLPATAAVSKAMQAHKGAGEPTPDSRAPADDEAALSKLPPNFDSEGYKSGDGTYELVAEGPGINGLPPMVYGAVWNPFPGMREFVTYGAKHIKLWRPLPSGSWTGEMGLRNDGTRVGDYSAANGGSAPAAASSGGGVASKAPLSASMTALTKVGKGNVSGSNPAAAAAAAKLKPKGTFGGVKGSAAAEGESGSGSMNKPSSQSQIGGESIVSAEYVRYNVIVTGHPLGALGIWLVTHQDASNNPVDPRVSPELVAEWNVNLIQRVSDAHGVGARINLNDGTTTYGGIRGLCLRADGDTLLTAGADGWIHTWEVSDGLVAVAGRPRTDGPGKPGVEKKVAVVLRRLAKNATQKNGPHSFQITSPYRGEGPPAIRALDCRPPAKPGDELPMEFVFGTNRCEVWEIEYKPGAKRPTVSVQVYGHMADLYAVATHPRDPNVFATASAADRVYLWNAAERNMVRTAPTGVVGRSVAFSVDPVPASAVYFPGWTPPAKPKPKPKPGQYDVPNPNAPVEIPAGHHLAIGGKFGNVAIIDAVTLQPLAKLKESAKEVSDLKYCQGPRPMLAVGSHDLCVDVYDVERGYVHLSRCQGHQASINHLDWSLPMTLHGVENRRVLQTSCASYEILYWDPLTGKQVLASQRDTRWATWTNRIGFPVMGVWEDGSDGTDVNAVDVAQCGRAFQDKKKKIPLVRVAEGANGLDGAGYCVTADDFGKVKLFNYPCVFNDAPYREYKGHASHTMCARFSSDDARLFSAGGRDRAVLQFKTKKIKLDEDPEEEVVVEAPKRVWGPIDGGKAYGWIETGGVGGPRKAPPKPKPPMAAVGATGAKKKKSKILAMAENDSDSDDDAAGQKHAKQQQQSATKAPEIDDDIPTEVAPAASAPPKMSAAEFEAKKEQAAKKVPLLF